MLIQHSPSIMVHRLAASEARAPQTMLALVAQMRAQMAIEVAANHPDAPGNDIEAAQTLVDKKA